MDAKKKIMLSLFMISLLSLNVNSLLCGGAEPENEEAAGVTPSVCRIFEGTPEFDDYIITCDINSGCVRFVKPLDKSRYMQREVCEKLRCVVNQVCAETDEKAVVAVQTALDTAFTENVDSPLVEGRGARFYTDTYMTNDRLSDIAVECGFDFVSNNCNHVYASIKGESPDQDTCSNIETSWAEASHTPAPFMMGSIVAAALATVRDSGHRTEPLLTDDFAIKMDEGVTKGAGTIIKGFGHELGKAGGRFFMALLIKLLFMDQVEVMCDNINDFILLRVDLTKPDVIYIVDFFIRLLEPFYVLAILLTAFYLLFVSGSPLGRARAKSTLLWLILSIGVIILTVPLIQLLLDLIYLLSTFTLGLADIEIAKKFICTECMNALNFEFFAIMSISFWSGVFIAMFQLVFYLGAILVLVLRFFMVILWTVLFPLTVFLYSFHFTRRLGIEMLYQTGWWIVTQFIEAVIFVGITLAVIHMPLQLVGEPAFRISMGLAACTLIIVGPLFAMGLMDWLAMVSFALAAMEAPLHEIAELSEEAKLEGIETEEISPPKPVGPPKGSPW